MLNRCNTFGRILHRTLWGFLLAPVAAAGLAAQQTGTDRIGLQTEPVGWTGYQQIRYVSLADGSDDAGERVLAACKANGVFFLDNVLPDNVKKQIDRGVMVGAGRRQDSAEVGRKYTKRKMPW